MLVIIAIAAMIAVDQLVKYWAVSVLKEAGTIPLLDQVFQLTYVENRGAAFSMLRGKVWFFVVFTIVVVGIIIYLLRTGRIHGKMGRWSLYMVIGGAVGNLIDRIFRGYVVDLFDFTLIHFPVFNVADILVCVGGVLFCVYYIFLADGKKNAGQRGAE